VADGGVFDEEDMLMKPAAALIGDGEVGVERFTLSHITLLEKRWKRGDGSVHHY